MANGIKTAKHKTYKRDMHRIVSFIIIVIYTQTDTLISSH